MPEKRKYHCVLKKLRPEERTVYQQAANPSEFEDVFSEEAEIGATAQYVQPLDEASVEAFRQASNAISVEPVEDVQADPLDTLGEVANATLPDPATEKYHGADKLPASADGRGVTVLGADTGLSEVVAEKLRDAGVKVLAGHNWTVSPPGRDTEDRNGHGSGTGAMCVLGTRGAFVPMKVLGDDGRGGSDGIVKSMYWAGKYADANPGRQVIANYSLSGAGDTLFAPYVEAMKYATDRGVVFVCSAGNDGKNVINRPANTCRVNNRVCSSIAFDKATDGRASFSNFDEDGSFSDAGHKEIGYKHTGKLFYLSGTSFSAPNSTYLLTRLATEYEAHSAFAALKATARNSPESQREEGSGVADAAAALKKLQPERAPEPPEPKEPDAYYPGVKRQERWAWVLKNVPNERVVLTWKGHPLGLWTPKPPNS